MGKREPSSPGSLSYRKGVPRHDAVELATRRVPVQSAKHVLLARRGASSNSVILRTPPQRHSKMQGRGCCGGVSPDRATSRGGDQRKSEFGRAPRLRKAQASSRSCQLGSCVRSLKACVRSLKLAVALLLLLPMQLQSFGAAAQVYQKISAARAPPHVASNQKRQVLSFPFCCVACSPSGV